MSERTLSASRVRIQFGKTPLSVASLRNIQTATTLCKGGAQHLLVRTPHAIADPIFLTEVESSELASGALRVALRDQSTKFRAQLELSPSADGIAFHLSLSAPEPVWVVEYHLQGIDLEEVILPASGGLSLTHAMPPETTLTYKYPFRLNAQFVLGIARGGGLWLRSKDVRPVFKFIRVTRSRGKFDIAYGIEADGPLKSKSFEATWYLDCFEGTWKVPADIHRKWLEEAFALAPVSSNPSMPGWGRETNFILSLGGVGTASSEPNHTFAQMTSRLQKWARMHDPLRTLVYLPRIALHAFGSGPAGGVPSAELGGIEQFKSFIAGAHELGYHVMIHADALCMAFDHPQFWRFEHMQVMDIFGRRQVKSQDIDGDRLAEPVFAYINPGAKDWGELSERAIGESIRDYGVDAIFLDHTLQAFNASRGPNFVDGMREYLRRLKTAFPKTLFVGEGLHEHIAGILPFAQIRGAESGEEASAREARTGWRKVHPISRYLFGKYARFTSPLLTPHPSHPIFAAESAAYSKLGVIPSLNLYRHEDQMETPEVRKIIRRAKRIKGSS
ncbi:MAG TPA: hypothetical protein VL126_06685 [Bacteroidota bacterium]|nr:hypothetical protein [Bacteroidota bacterium]